MRASITKQHHSVGSNGQSKCGHDFTFQTSPWQAVCMHRMAGTQLKQDDELPVSIAYLADGTSQYESEIRAAWNAFKLDPTPEKAREFIDFLMRLSDSLWPEVMAAVLGIEISELNPDHLQVLEDALEEHYSYMEESLLPDVVRAIANDNLSSLDYRTIVLYAGALWQFGNLATVMFDGLKLRDLADLFMFAGPNDSETCTGDNGCEQYANGIYTVAQILAEGIIPGRLRCLTNCRHFLLPIASPLKGAEKHQMGRHDQGKHRPKKYGKGAPSGLPDRVAGAFDEILGMQLSTQCFVMDMAQWLRLKHLAQRRLSQLLHRPDDYILKHLSGQHDQGKHRPKKYGKRADASPLDYTDKYDYSRAKLGMTWSEKLVDGKWVKREGLASDEELSAIIGAERDWENEVYKAIGRGDIKVEQDRHGAPYLTGHAFDNTRLFLPEIKNAVEFGPLPMELYHVTSAKTAVVDDSGGLLKSRYDLEQERARGLGGGSENTISYTTDKAMAENIRDSMLEARTVAKGDVTFDDLIDQAAKGEGAQEPWLRDWMKMETGQEVRPGEPLPERLRLEGSGHEVESYALGATKADVTKAGTDPSSSFHAKFAPKEGHGKWEPVGEGWETASGDKAYTQWKRIRPEAATRQWTFDRYKSWLGFREYAGGSENPLFWGTDAEYLASIDPDEIAILKYKPKPGAVGVKKSALGEWRTWDGEAIELESVE